jgi:hypothetical protein
MFDFYAGLIKALISVILVAVGYGFKVLGDRRQARIAKEEREEQSWRDQRQRYWSPLLQSAREFSSRLEDLSHIYRTDKVWEESLNMFTPEGLSGDFRELYALSRDPIQDLIGSDNPRPAVSLFIDTKGPEAVPIGLATGCTKNQEFC